MLNDRARELASLEMSPVSHHMSLEDQGVKGKAHEAQLSVWATMLLNGPRRDLW